MTKVSKLLKFFRHDQSYQPVVATHIEAGPQNSKEGKDIVVQTAQEIKRLQGINSQIKSLQAKAAINVDNHHTDLNRLKIERQDSVEKLKTLLVHVNDPNLLALINAADDPTVQRTESTDQLETARLSTHKVKTN